MLNNFLMFLEKYFCLYCFYQILINFSKLKPCHNIAEILLKLVLNTNQSTS